MTQCGRLREHRTNSALLFDPPKCYGPMPVAVTKRHPMVYCEHMVDEAGIRVWRCPVCFRFVLEWL